ncbi:MAG: acyltransferase family protein [Ruminococcus sp.]|nr:acyltransferase family protein [Ruminococcus sp.]
MGKLITLRKGEASGGRYAGVDIVKIIAMYSVLTLHFCLYAGYYDFPVATGSGVLLSLLRMASYMCVPLFLTISGFLMHRAEFCARHYIKAVPVAINSYIVGVIVMLFKMFYLHEKWSPFVWFRSIYQFAQPSYGWYVNMYLSLLLFMPFINYAYRSMKTGRMKLAALGVIMLTANLPFTINNIPITVDGEASNIGWMPSYFCGLWPVAYYWSGMMIAEYRPKINKLVNVVIVLLLLLGEIAVNAVTAKPGEGGGWYTGFNFNNEDFLNVIVAAFIFLIFYDIRIKNKAVCRVLSAVAGLSVTVYLMSFIGDVIYVKHFIKGDNSPAIFITRYLRIIPLHFLLTVLVSFPVNFLAKLLGKLVSKPLYLLADHGRRKKETSPAAAETAEE